MDTPAPFEPYACSLGTVLDHGDGTFYRIARPDGQVEARPANGVPSPEDVEADLANPPAPAPAPVPAHVGPAHLRIAMRRLHGITAGQVYAAISAIPDQAAQDDARDLWDYATEIRRDHPLVASFAAAFALTPAQVDDTFRLAATI